MGPDLLLLPPLLLLTACTPDRGPLAVASRRWTALLQTAWTADSNQPGAAFGADVASAGDVNGDGYDDLLVGAPYADDVAIDEGIAFVFLGSATGPELVPSWSAASGQAGAQFGLTVGSAGDVNGDGFDDIAVGAPLYDDGNISEGAAFVFLGSAAGLSTTASWTAESDFTSGFFGRSPGSAGDVDGDGYGDLIVGECGLERPEYDACRAHVFLGSAAGLAPDPVWTAASTQTDSMFGFVVAGAGDIDADGFGDVLVGAYQQGENPGTHEGAAFLYRGSPAGPWNVPAWVAYGPEDGARFGISLAAAGDVDGDGRGEVIVGADLADGATLDEGRAFVFRGVLGGLAQQPSWSAASGQPYSYFGHSVAGVGDVDGDTFDDIAVGAWGWDAAEVDEGSVSVFLGSALGLGNVPAYVDVSGQASAALGVSVAAAGDVDGDGLSDVIAGADLFDLGQVDEGVAVFLAGSCVDTDLDAACDAVDDDDDDDGVADTYDSDPLDPLVCRDSEPDRCDDCSSGVDDPRNDGQDSDGDGLCDPGDSDDDADGVTDRDDPAPLDAGSCGDDDGDGCDDCDPAEQLDTDDDGACDAGDPAEAAGRVGPSSGPGCGCNAGGAAGSAWLAVLGLLTSRRPNKRR